MDAVLHKISNSENFKTEDEILLTANEILQILITDVDDLLRSIENKTDFSYEDPKLNCTEGQKKCEMNQDWLIVTDCKTGLTSEPPDLTIIEGQINCEIKFEDLQENNECKNGFSTVQSDLNFTGQILYDMNQDETRNECKINLNFEQQEFNFSGIQINCKTIQEDFVRSTEWKNSLTEPESNLFEGQMKCEISREDLLQISECMTGIISTRADLSNSGQISCKFNLEAMTVITKCNIGLSSEQPILSVKGGQINCEINLEDLLRATEDKTNLKSEQPNMIVIEGQMDFEINAEDLLGITECKIDFRIDQSGLNVEGQISYEISMKDLLKVTECKTNLTSEQLASDDTEDQKNLGSNHEDLLIRSFSSEQSALTYTEQINGKNNQDSSLFNQSFGDT